MSYRGTIGLFTEPQESRRGPSAFFVSSVVHIVGIGMLSYGILNHPIIRDRIITERYSVRHLELHAPEPRRDGGENAAPYLALQSAQQTKDGNNETKAAILKDASPEGGGHQTLVQPEFHSHLALSVETPVPTIMIWTPELSASSKVVPPAPDKATAAEAKPSLDAPNEELDLADNSVTATDLTPQMFVLPSGTSSPIVAKSEELAQLAPATISDSNEQPTPTALLSLSDIRMPEGEVILPPVNETQSLTPSDTLGQQKAKPASVDEKALPAKETAITGAETQAMNPPDKPDAAASFPHQPDSARTGAGRELGAQDGAGDRDEAYHITMPENGKFSVVVIGTSLSDEYPETLQFWNDRVAYTAYLHVGLSKNWILQYSMVRSAEAAASGNVARLEAPWPYDIMRPNLVSSDLNADALMIHGILNQAGRFESLAIAFPLQYIRAAFVLRALQQWQFRPARQNGKAISVEVLLIIPDELE